MKLKYSDKRCPNCKEQIDYNSKTIFTTLLNTMMDFDFCSIDCLRQRIDEMNNDEACFYTAEAFPVDKDTQMFNVLLREKC